MIWSRKLDKVEPISQINKLPLNGIQFFFQNWKDFKKEFAILTTIGFLSSVLHISVTITLAELVNLINNIEAEQIVRHYLPLLLSIYIIKEVLDYFRRRYSEALPSIYIDYIKIRFYRSIFNINTNRILNYSKERLEKILQKYLDGVGSFLGDWIWRLPGEITNLVIIVVILGVQSPVILGINIVYMTIYFVVALKLSAKLSPIYSEYLKKQIDANSIANNFFLNLNSLKRLLAVNMAENSSKRKFIRSWTEFDKVRSYHSRRWYLQLNLFNFIYVGTLIAGAIQIANGGLEIGFLLLIKWAYDSLWSTMQYITEYYVRFIEEKENAKILNRELSILISNSSESRELKPSNDWERITLKGVSTTFPTKDGGTKTIQVPELVIDRGSQIIILGESGSGKSTIMDILLGIIEYEGELILDEKRLHGKAKIALINSNSSFFNCSIKENLLLGQMIPATRVQEVIDGVEASSFINDLNDEIGTSATNFSSGQFQRLRIAQGLLQNADLYLLDEPFNGIDSRTKQSIISFLQGELRGKSIIMVTHNKLELSFLTDPTIYQLDESILKKIA